jgi:hypothetical protein
MKISYLIFSLVLFIHSLYSETNKKITVENFLSNMRKINNEYKKRIIYTKKEIFSKLDHDKIADMEIKKLEKELTEYETCEEYEGEYKKECDNIKQKIEEIENKKKKFEENSDYTYIPTQALLFTEDELNTIFEYSIQFIQDFFDIESIEEVKKDFYENTDIKSTTLNNFLKTLFQKIKQYCDPILQKIKNDQSEFDYFNIIQQTTEDKKEILVTTDNHTSQNYFEFLSNKLENPYSNEVFCGDVIDRSQHYYLNNLPQNKKDELINNFSSIYEKKLLICDFLKSILLLTTKIFVHQTHPDVYFEVLGNHEEEAVLCQDIKYFLTKFKIDIEEFPYSEISQIMTKTIPAQIITLYKKDNSVNVFNHSGGGFYLPIEQLNITKTMNQYHETTKINYSKKIMIDVLKTHQNNDIYHNTYKKKIETENILTSCDFNHNEENEISMDKDKIEIKYNNGRGIKIKNMEHYITNYLPMIYKKMICEAFPEINITQSPLSYNLYYGHQHDEENLALLLNKYSGYNELHRKHNTYVSSIFLPPASWGNSYGLYRNKILHNLFYKNKTSCPSINQELKSHDLRCIQFKVEELKLKNEEKLKELAKLISKIERQIGINTALVSISSAVSGVLLKEILKDSLPKGIGICREGFSTFLSNLKQNRETPLPSVEKVLKSKTFWITLAGTSFLYVKLKNKQLSNLSDIKAFINQKK